MNGDDAEMIADAESAESGLDDRPRCDPLVYAVCRLELRLHPRPGAEAALVGDRIVYPADGDPTEIAYLVSHECGHVLARDAGVAPELEEWIASRIGVALMLPRRRYRRDLHAVGWDLDLLTTMWPLASPWIHARRIAEVTIDGAVASRWTARGCTDRVRGDDVVIPATATALERSLARAAMQGETIDAGPRLRAWPTREGAIVVCGADDLYMRLARTAPVPAARATG